MDAFEGLLSEFADDYNADLERGESAYIMRPRGEWEEEYATKIVSGMNDSEWNSDERFADIVASPVIVDEDGGDVEWGIRVLEKEQYELEQSAGDRAVRKINQALAESDLDLSSLKNE